MAALTWDQVGVRTYEAGVDRGVLFLKDGTAVVWNGLTGVEEQNTRETKSYYMDGLKYLEPQVPGDYSAKLSAFTFPEEFEACIGIRAYDYGVSVYDQPPKRFNLSYRTKLGDDLVGLDRGYRIHLVYNLLATPDNVPYNTIGENVAPIDFGWSLSSIPTPVEGHRPTAHLTIDSTKVDPEDLELIESLIYGTTHFAPYLPTPDEIIAILDPASTGIVIVDRGGGLWSAFGSAEHISIAGDDTFTITGVDAIFPDEDSYTITTTT